MARKRGMTTYSRALRDEICRRVADGETLSSVCEDEEMPSRQAVAQWIMHDKDGMKELYTTARYLGGDAIADHVIDIADQSTNEESQRARNRIDARKWYLAKYFPRRFGDQVESDGPTRAVDLSRLTDAQLSEYGRLAAIAAGLDPEALFGNHSDQEVEDEVDVRLARYGVTKPPMLQARATYSPDGDRPAAQTTIESEELRPRDAD